MSAARTSKQRRSSMDITNEEEGEGEDNLGSPSLFNNYDQEVGTGKWQLLWELGHMEQEQAASQWFPDHSLSSSRCQHKYNFIKKASQVAHAADHNSHDNMVRALDTVLAALEECALVMVISNKEGWDTASCLVEDKASFLTERKGQVKEAQKKAQGIHQQKGKPKVFQNSQRRGRPGQAQGAWPVKSASAASTSLPPATNPGDNSKSRTSMRLACFMCSSPHLAKSCPKKFGSSK
jgi:hypothetical protein